MRPWISAYITARPGTYEAFHKLVQRAQLAIYADTDNAFQGESPMMLDENGLTVITVKKTTLLEALKKNLEKHVAEFRVTRAGYEIAFVEKAEALLAEARKGNFEVTRIDLEKPHSHERDYTRVINMLTMSIDEEIKISDTQFSQYVEDEWSWKGAFMAANSTYGKFSRAAGR